MYAVEGAKSSVRDILAKLHSYRHWRSATRFKHVYTNLASSMMIYESYGALDTGLCLYTSRSAFYFGLQIISTMFFQTSLLVLLHFLNQILPSHGQGAPYPGSSYWLANIKRQGNVAFGDPNYPVYRNVQDPMFGAKGA